MPHIKPYWTSEVKKAHKNARQKRKIWVSEGKPRGMVYEAYKNYKTAKSEFRSIQQKAIYDHENNTFAELNNAAEHDIRLFWRLFKGTKGKKSNVCYKLKYNNVEARDPQTIAYLFSDYFKMLYSSVNAQTNSNYSEDTQTVPETVDIADIIQAVKHLKRKKHQVLKRFKMNTLSMVAELFICVSVIFLMQLYVLIIFQVFGKRVC